MAPSATQISTVLVQLWAGSAPAVASCHGVTVFANGQSRPIMVRDQSAFYASLQYPIYGAGGGYGLGVSDPISVSVITTGSDNVMTGNVKVREAWHREDTKERGWVGEEMEDWIELGNTPSRISVTSNSWSYFDRGITHRVFYVMFEELGVYYEAAKVAYTGDSDTLGVGDTIEINVSPEVIIFNRPLEDLQQTRQFPAVTTMTFWKGRIWGACLEPREFDGVATLSFTQGSNIVTLNQNGGSEAFRQSDHYKGIVDRRTNQIVAYIDRVIHHTSAIIRMPDDVEEESVWPDADMTIPADQIGISGDQSAIYSTPIYAGGPGGSILYGIMTWCPLDMLRDDGFYATGSKVVKVITAGDELCVIYSNGIGFYSGDVSAGAPPTVRHIIGAKKVGTLNPDAVWQAKDGSVWMVGGGRIFTIKNGEVADMSAEMGVAGFWGKFTEAYGQGQREFQVAYNPDSNIALMVNVPKKGEGTGEYGTYAVALCHDTTTIHPIRFPVKVTAIDCAQIDTGDYQFYGGTADSRIYRLLVRGRKSDSFYNSEGALVEGQPVPWHYTTGVLWANGIVRAVAVRFLIDTDAGSGVIIQVGVDSKSGNLNSASFAADKNATINHDTANRIEWYYLNALEGYAVQYKISGNTMQDFTLLGMMALEDYMEARGE